MIMMTTRETRGNHRHTPAPLRSASSLLNLGIAPCRVHAVTVGGIGVHAIVCLSDAKQSATTREDYTPAHLLLSLWGSGDFMAFSAANRLNPCQPCERPREVSAHVRLLAPRLSDGNM
jgi:hypothetical protein